MVKFGVLFEVRTEFFYLDELRFQRVNVKHALRALAGTVIVLVA
jgi:hypothetical protein